MDDDPLPTINIPQKALITFEEPCGITVEKTSVVWGAAEALTSPDLETRQGGLQQLVNQDAVRHHPLVAYLLITRLVEPDIALRSQIVDALAEVVTPNGHGEPEEASAYSTLSMHLTGMRTRQIYALLQVVDYEKSNESKVIGLLDLLIRWRSPRILSTRVPTICVLPYLIGRWVTWMLCLPWSEWLQGLKLARMAGASWVAMMTTKPGCSRRLTIRWSYCVPLE
jgi:hypothetical protein